MVRKRAVIYLFYFCRDYLYATRLIENIPALSCRDVKKRMRVKRPRFATTARAFYGASSILSERRFARSCPSVPLTNFPTGPARYNLATGYLTFIIHGLDCPTHFNGANAVLLDCKEYDAKAAYLKRET